MCFPTMHAKYVINKDSFFNLKSFINAWKSFVLLHVDFWYYILVSESKTNAPFWTDFDETSIEWSGPR